MFTKTAQFYDKIYAFKDYPSETARLKSFIKDNLRSGGNRLLDVACGTGKHLEYLKAHYEVQGLDLDAELLAAAHKRCPEVKFHQADMIDFDLNDAFDVVTCLFSSIGYVKTMTNLEKALRCMAKHLVPGGLLVIEPWFTPDVWQPGMVHALLVDEPELKIARVNTSFANGRLSYMDMHYLIGTPEGTQHFVERHELGLFTIEEQQSILESVGLDVIYDVEGLTGRGLFIARKQL